MQAWQVISSRPLVQRPPWLLVWEEDVQLPNGKVIPGYLRTRDRDYAMVFAFLPNGTVPLVRQYKHGIGRASYDLPAGYLEDQEEPLKAAQRELAEETGLVARRWRLLGHLVIDSNRGDTTAHLYLATEVHAAGRQKLDPTESLEISYHTLDQLRYMVFAGEIDSMASVAGIMMALQLLQAQDRNWL